MNPAVPSHAPWRSALRPRLALALLAASLLATWALWTAPDQAALPRAKAGDPVQPGVQPSAMAVPAAGVATGPQGRAATARLVLPAVLDAVVLEAAMHDPFVGTVPVPPRPPAPPPRGSAGQASLANAAAVPAPPSPPMPPTAPSLNYRFMARITSPAGTALTFVAKGDQVLQVQAGQRLDEGYVVESVDEQAVRLHFPPLDVRAVIAIAPAAVAPSYVGAR